MARIRPIATLVAGAALLCPASASAAVNNPQSCSGSRFVTGVDGSGDLICTTGTGPRGATGPRGPRGKQGLRGLRGLRGFRGIAGPAGPAGPIGPVGPAGAKGASGDGGPQGDKGDKGDKGDQGDKGDKGDKGDPGFTTAPNGDRIFDNPGKEFIFNSNSFHVMHPTETPGVTVGINSSSGGPVNFGFFGPDGLTGFEVQGPDSTPAVKGGVVVVGDGTVTGDLLVGGDSTAAGQKFFRIDHPLDPERRWLYHASIESSEVLNQYSGNVRTDGRGYATVKLPAYFGALNRDPRYQLTVVRSFARAAVWRKVRGNRFVIRTSRPRIEVSWQVTGIRNDAYARSHPMRASVAKTAAERR